MQEEGRRVRGRQKGRGEARKGLAEWKHFKTKKKSAEAWRGGERTGLEGEEGGEGKDGSEVY